MKLAVVHWKSFILVALGVATALFCVASPAMEAGDHAGVEMRLPERVLGREGARQEMSAAEREILPADTGYERKVYPGREGAADVICTIVLSGSDRRSLHRPEVCLPGQGWTIESTEIVELEMGEGEELAVKKLGLSQVVDRGDGEKAKVEALYLYWYVGKDVTTPSTMERVLISAFDNVARNVNHRWAYVSAMALVSESYRNGGADGPATVAMLEEFVRESAPRFMKTASDL